MIAGLEIFEEHFREYPEHYVLIGGVAAMLWLEDAGLSVRATKDFDLVILAENLNDRFLSQFWSFVKAGGYDNLQKSSDKRIYYRFADPATSAYPYSLEIFARVPERVKLWGDARIVPIPAEEDESSLSAILMDEAYYAVVRDHTGRRGGLRLLLPEGLILLKARAWLDMHTRKQSGQHVDDRDLKKHRTDVFRLALLLTRNRSAAIDPKVYEDLLAFLGHFPKDSTEWGAIRQASGMNNTMPPPAELHEIITKYFRPA
ncbi:MAG: hypothetical protein HYV27_01185 [Candidatus Hydrogenedentes bacterium]|nr:hypothetical protein [Candidatus Hydrogenedentota bacterium]